MTERPLLLAVLSLALTACVGSQSPPVEPTAAVIAQASGVDRFNEGNHRAALDRFMKALHEHRLLDDSAGIVTSCINIARTFHAAGNPVQARLWAEQAREQMSATSLPENDALRQNLTLLSAQIHVSSNEHDAAEAELAMLDSGSDSLILSAASRLNTEIAFHRQQGMTEALNAYSNTVARHAPTSLSHLARIDRFRASLEQDASVRDELYESAIVRYRELGRQNAIATTLQEWATSNPDADDSRSRLLRALYIRIDRRDAAEVDKILDQLAENSDAELERTTSYWREKLKEPGFDLWRNLLLEFDDFPR